MHFSAAGPVSGPEATRAAALPDLLVFSPLRWDGERQRPQQLLTRLAKHYRVLYVEEPVTTHEDAFLEVRSAAPGVEVLLPHTRVAAAGFADAQLPAIRPLLAAHLAEREVAAPLVWFYTPMALPLVDDLTPAGVVVDGLDDWSTQPDANATLVERETQLLALADVAIAGGPSTYAARRARHANVHCIPNAVDAAEFAPAALAGTTIEAVSARALHAAMPGPRLGWFGTIDERMDLDLVARIADLRPDWHLVMAGEVSGIDPQTLPQRPNLHWIGPQTRAILPHLQAHWDACVLPLKPEVAARRPSPIEALEFLAGQKSVVATPVHDVVALYGHIVRFAPNADGFVEACRAAISERGPLRRQRRIDALIAVHSCTWDRAAERVHRLLVEFAHEPARVGEQAVERAPVSLVVAAAVAQQHAGTGAYAAL